MPLVRLSPSGPGLVIELETDQIDNQSVVPGANVTEALDYLLTANQYQLFDEFLGGTSQTFVANQDGLIGELGWSFVTSGGQIARPLTGDYVGAYQITADPSQISGLRCGPDGGGSSANFPVSTLTFIEWLAAPNLTQLVSGTSRFGIGSAVATAQFGGDGLFFEAAAATSPNWRVVSRRASINTTVTTSIAWNPSSVARLTFSKDDATSGMRAFIDGVLVATFTAGQLPSQVQNGMMQIVAAAGSAQSAAVDTFKLDFDR